MDEITDNSETLETQEPQIEETVLGDNSEEEATTEPEESQEPKPEEKGKFETLDAALKGYANLEKKLGEQSNELGELRKQAEIAKQLQKEQLQIAKNYGFNSVEDFKNAQIQSEYDRKLAEYEADQYAQFLDKCDYPDEMQKLLVSYRQNPAKETLELIEADFPVDVVKKVAGSMAIAKGQLQAQMQEARMAQIRGTAKAYLDENVNKYAKEFENQAFTALYGEAFRAYGCDLNTDKFVELMRNYANTIQKAANINNGINLENANATSEIAGLSDSKGSAGNVQSSGKSLLNMSEKELDKRLSELI